MNKRPNKNDYYLDIAKSVAERSTCLSKHYGAVLVKDDEIIATGYNGAPRGRKNCSDDLGYCKRQNTSVARGMCYDTSCRSVHAEQNAIISAARKDMIGSTLYLYGWDMIRDQLVENADCCPVCKRMVINAGIEKVIIRARSNYGITLGSDIFGSDASGKVVYPTITKEINVSDWIENDASLNEQEGY